MYICVCVYIYICVYVYIYIYALFDNTYIVKEISVLEQAQIWKSEKKK